MGLNRRIFEFYLKKRNWVKNINISNFAILNLENTKNENGQRWNWNGGEEQKCRNNIDDYMDYY